MGQFTPISVLQKWVAEGQRANSTYFHSFIFVLIVPDISFAILK